MIKIWCDHPDYVYWNKNSHYIHFTNDINENVDYILYIYNPQLVINDNRNKPKNALIIEPYIAVKEAIDFISIHHNLFKYIYTHDDNLLKLSNAKIFYWGGVWDSCPKEKIKNLSIISSNYTWLPLHRKRLELANYIKINNLGDTYGTFDGGPYIDTQTAYSEYKFAIAIENYIEDYWFTEKICNCFANKTIPIYLGARKINTLFNKNGIIQVDDTEEIKQLLNSNFNYQSEYEKRFNAIEENYCLVNKYKNVWDLFYEMYKGDIIK